MTERTFGLGSAPRWPEERPPAGQQEHAEHENGDEERADGEHLALFQDPARPDHRAVRQGEPREIPHPTAPTVPLRTLGPVGVGCGLQSLGLAIGTANQAWHSAKLAASCPICYGTLAPG